MPEKLSNNNNNTPVRNNTRKTYRHVQGFAQAEKNRSATTPYTAKAAAQRREGAPYKSLKPVTTPKAKTMKNILRNLAPAPKTRSKALLKRLGKNNSAAAVANNLASINFSAQEQPRPAQEQPRPNVGKLFNEFQANNWVRQGRAADLGSNFNVFEYEPKRGLFNNRRRLIKTPFNNDENELEKVQAAQPPRDPFANINWRATNSTYLPMGRS